VSFFFTDFPFLFLVGSVITGCRMDIDLFAGFGLDDVSNYMGLTLGQLR